jgi:hypothetical protein
MLECSSPPPRAFGTMWSTSVADDTRPLAAHNRHSGSLASTAARNRCHREPYPRAVELLPP